MTDKFTAGADGIVSALTAPRKPGRAPGIPSAETAFVSELTAPKHPGLPVGIAFDQGIIDKKGQM